jgi:hypothetical protein
VYEFMKTPKGWRVYWGPPPVATTEAKNPEQKGDSRPETPPAAVSDGKSPQTSLEKGRPDRA